MKIHQRDVCYLMLNIKLYDLFCEKVLIFLEQFVILVLLKFSEEIDLMVSRSVTIQNSVGLHARPATFFIQKANSYKCSIWVEKEDCRVNAKSLLGVLSLGIVKGTTITVIADGNDENEAVSGLVDLVSGGFPEL